MCPICGNSDKASIGYLQDKPYCRKCIVFRGEKVQSIFLHQKEAVIHLGYELSNEQTALSNRLIKNYVKGIDSLVNAVCGSPQLCFPPVFMKTLFEVNSVPSNL